MGAIVEVPKGEEVLRIPSRCAAANLQFDSGALKSPRFCLGGCKWRTESQAGRLSWWLGHSRSEGGHPEKVRNSRQNQHNQLETTGMIDCTARSGNAGSRPRYRPVVAQRVSRNQRAGPTMRRKGNQATLRITACVHVLPCGRVPRTVSGNSACRWVYTGGADYPGGGRR